MLDIKFIRENKDVIEAGAKKKHIPFNVHELISVDDQRLVALQAFEALRAEQNQMSDKISAEKDALVRTQMIEAMRVVKEDLKTKEEQLREVLKRWQELMLQVPNVPDITVPEGESDEQNRSGLRQRFLMSQQGM
jgi:seryl-tRNA synthetase